MSTPLRKGPRPRRDPGEQEITRFEMQRIFKGEEEGLAKLLAYLHCSCDRPGRHIVNYTVHVNKLNDLVLRGACSACGGQVGRYLETGEDPKKVERIRALLLERKKGKG
jgi:hypothetical protein